MTVVRVASALVLVFAPGLADIDGGHYVKQRRLKEFLRGGWSDKPQSRVCSSLDIKLYHQLLKGGVAGVAWNNRKHLSQNSPDDSEQGLKNTYQSLAVLEVRDQAEISKVGRWLKESGVRAITFKGRALSSYYSPTHIRPTGDLDIIVPEKQFDATVACLKERSVIQNKEPNNVDHTFFIGPPSNGSHLKVDLHRSLCRFGLLSTEELFTTAEVSVLPDLSLFSVPCLEHHLRIVAIHFLRHGGWRPLWLCDIAALMDVIDTSFNWGLCLGENRIFSEWIVLTMMLAEQELGAKSLLYPIEYRDMIVPGWITETIDEEWGQPESKRYRRPRFRDVTGFKNCAEEIWLRWPNPLVAMTTRERTLLRGPVFLSQSTYFWERCRKFVGKRLKRSQI